MSTILRAPRVTTIVTSAGTLHALDTSSGGAFLTVCGRTLARTSIVMRSAPTADAYVTCERCRTRLRQGYTVSGATVRRARLSARLAEDTAGIKITPASPELGHGARCPRATRQHRRGHALASSGRLGARAARRIGRKVSRPMHVRSVYDGHTPRRDQGGRQS